MTSVAEEAKRAEAGTCRTGGVALISSAGATSSESCSQCSGTAAGMAAYAAAARTRITRPQLGDAVLAHWRVVPAAPALALRTAFGAGAAAAGALHSSGRRRVARRAPPRSGSPGAQPCQFLPVTQDKPGDGVVAEGVGEHQEPNNDGPTQEEIENEYLSDGTEDGLSLLLPVPSDQCGR